MQAGAERWKIPCAGPGRLRRPLAAARAPHPVALGSPRSPAGPRGCENPQSRPVSGRCHTSPRAGGVVIILWFSAPLRKMLSAGEGGYDGIFRSYGVCVCARVCDININHCPHPSPTQATTVRCATVPSKCLRWALQPDMCAENE